LSEFQADKNAERRYQIAVRRNLTRNFMVHLAHGMLGQTGFKLLNAPTFLPAYLLMLSGGSSLAVGLGLALQSFGNMLTPLFGASLIEHRKRVLPMAFIAGGAMRLSVLGIALSGLWFEPRVALICIFGWLMFFGLCSGMQQVTFSFLMSKVIPVNMRGRLTGLRNFLAGITSAAVAMAGGTYLLGTEPDAQGYSYTFILAFALTACGLLSMLAMKEPEPPTTRNRQSLRNRLGDIPALLRSDKAFTRYFLARALATTGRMALPFYILYAGDSLALTGANLAIVTVAFTLSATVSNLLWGLLADRHGFRLVFLCGIGLWILATLGLLVSSGLIMTCMVFAGIGAAVQGFQNAGMNMALEFGDRDDLPLRIAIASTSAELAGALGPLIGGGIAVLFGYSAMFGVSIAFLTAGGVMVLFFVPEPRQQRSVTRARSG
jgi:MFS family permease